MIAHTSSIHCSESCSRRPRNYQHGLQNIYDLRTEWSPRPSFGHNAMNKQWFPSSPRGVVIGVSLFLILFGLAPTVMAVMGAMGMMPFRVNGRDIQEVGIGAAIPFILIFFAVSVGGVAMLPLLRVGVEVTEEGITAVSYRGNRNVIWWRELSNVTGNAQELVLESGSTQIKIAKSYNWPATQAAIQPYLRGLAKASERPQAKSFASVSNPVFRSSHMKIHRLVAIVGLALSAVMFIVMFLTLKRSTGFIYIAIVGQTAMLVGLYVGAVRNQIELKSDGFTYTPRFGKPINIGYSEVRAFRYHTTSDSEGGVTEYWTISRDSGKDIRLPIFERMDEAVGVIASRMPQSSTFEGPNPLAGA